MNDQALVIAVLGAESTGKTTLVHQMQKHFQNQGLAVGLVPEVLREFCDRHQRTPRVDEQATIAQMQTQRMLEAKAQHQLVLADTTALMIGIYSEFVFGDLSVYPLAESASQHVDLTLLTSLDLPWVPDGLQRDGPHVREPVDAMLRSRLQASKVSYSLVSGQGEQRLQSALAAVEHIILRRRNQASGKPRVAWRWVCEKCDDGECEQHWLPGA